MSDTVTVLMLASAGDYIKGQTHALSTRRARHLIATGYAKPVAGEASSAPAASVTSDRGSQTGRKGHRS